MLSSYIISISVKVINETYKIKEAVFESEQIGTVSLSALIGKRLVHLFLLYLGRKYISREDVQRTASCA